MSEVFDSRNNEITPTAPVNQEELRKQRRMIVGIILGALFIIIVIGLAVWGLAQPTTDTGKVRDIFIIFMAFESFIIGLTLIILLFQLARLINLLQNEIKPIINSTNETVNTLRGTTVFLSNNLVEPVMKLNEYMAAFQQMLKLVGIGKKAK
jgi:NADH:ubiquinone oxidoreductase subunit K